MSEKEKNTVPAWRQQRRAISSKPSSYQPLIGIIIFLFGILVVIQQVNLSPSGEEIHEDKFTPGFVGLCLATSGLFLS